jgi:hypothetical protein
MREVKNGRRSPEMAWRRGIGSSRQVVGIWRSFQRFLITGVKPVVWLTPNSKSSGLQSLERLFWFCRYDAVLFLLIGSPLCLSHLNTHMDSPKALPPFKTTVGFSNRPRKISHLREPIKAQDNFCANIAPTNKFLSRPLCHNSPSLCNISQASKSEALWIQTAWQKVLCQPVRISPIHFTSTIHLSVTLSQMVF